MSRIKIEFTFKEAIVAMCDGNPGALTALAELFKAKGDDAIVLLCHLDDMGIYGSDIWLVYNDVCKRDVDTLIKLIPRREALLEDLQRVR